MWLRSKSLIVLSTHLSNIFRAPQITSCVNRHLKVAITSAAISKFTIGPLGTCDSHKNSRTQKKSIKISAPHFCTSQNITRPMGSSCQNKIHAKSLLSLRFLLPFSWPGQCLHAELILKATTYRIRRFCTNDSLNESTH